MLSKSILLLLSSAVPLVFGSPSQAPSIYGSDYDQLQDLFEEAHVKASELLKTQNGSCTAANIQVRKEWDNLTTAQKKDYIRAVKCLQSSPALTPSELGSGIKTRFDDFTGTHMNQTGTIHYTGNFLSWHRYFVHLFETALKDECGYTGTMPYWNWPKTAVTGLAASPVFDGSETSMSGDGYFVPNKSAINTGGGVLDDYFIPAGTGGGCVKSGPFVNYTVNLGPVSLKEPGGLTGVNPYNDTGIFSWNPRCMKRDLTDAINSGWANASSVLDCLEWDTINDFQLFYQGEPDTAMAGGTTLGVHGGGHFAYGGDPARDLYISPADPAFWLHHTMFDKVWWLWQMQDPENRIFGNNTVAGTNTMMDTPASANTTVDDYVEYGYAAGPPRQIKDLLSTMDGPFCYIYE